MVTANAEKASLCREHVALVAGKQIALCKAIACAECPKQFEVTSNRKDIEASIVHVLTLNQGGSFAVLSPIILNIRVRNMQLYLPNEDCISVAYQACGLNLDWYIEAR